jgi:23S rRNA pseudouridine1911/1915/1917 synthase
MQEYSVEPDDVGKRVDVFVSGRNPDFARSSLSVLFDNKLVYINNEPAKAGEKLREGDVIEIDEMTLYAEPESIDLPILYEDGDVIVINKPPGLLTHSKGNLNTEATIATFLKNKITDETLTGNRAGIVHRLDRVTSGVIIAAKTAKGLNWLQKQFSNRKTKKTYIAIVEGIPEPKEALIDAPIERNPKKPQTFRVGAEGKSAQTSYKVLQSFTRNGKKYSKLELKPVTGRTHQLRVHLTYIGHPIVGDKVYAKDGEYMYLHALTLELTLPSRTRKVFEVPLPEEFNKFVNDAK